MTREKRYKVLKVERYKKDLQTDKINVILSTIEFALSLAVYTLIFGKYIPIIPTLDGEENSLGAIIPFLLLGIGSIPLAYSLKLMLHSISSKVGLEQRIKDIELELEVDKQIEEEQQGKVKTLSLENGAHGTKH